MNDKIIHCYSVYSGQYYECLEKDFKFFKDGHLPLTKKPSFCKKCYGRGHRGKSITNLTYDPCSCVIKSINLDIINLNTQNGINK